MENRRIMKRARNVNQELHHSPLTYSPLTKNRNNFVTATNVYLTGSTRVVYTRKGSKPLAASPKPGSDLSRIRGAEEFARCLMSSLKEGTSPSRRCSLDSLQHKSEVRKVQPRITWNTRIRKSSSYPCNQWIGFWVTFIWALTFVTGVRGADAKLDLL